VSKLNTVESALKSHYESGLIDQDYLFQQATTCSPPEDDKRSPGEAFVLDPATLSD
jgi:hypothetical protein